MSGSDDTPDYLKGVEQPGFDERDNFTVKTSEEGPLANKGYDKYAVDGRDPNSYSGIFWVLGRYDRAWGPERPIFGKVRYMTSASAARKLRLKQYLRDHAAGPSAVGTVS